MCLLSCFLLSVSIHNISNITSETLYIFLYGSVLSTQNNAEMTDKYLWVEYTCRVSARRKKHQGVKQSHESREKVLKREENGAPCLMFGSSSSYLAVSTSKVWCKWWLIFYFSFQGLALFKWPDFFKKWPRLSKLWSKFKFTGQLSIATIIQYFIFESA